MFGGPRVSVAFDGWVGMCLGEDGPVDKSGPTRPRLISLDSKDLWPVGMSERFLEEDTEREIGFVDFLFPRAGILEFSPDKERMFGIPAP